MKLRRPFFARSVHDVAPELVGATLLVDGVGGRIVEVEAYDHEDPAAHGYRRANRTQRLDVRPARPRVRLPLVRRPLVPELRLRDAQAQSSIRALEPTNGLDEMAARRGTAEPRLLAAGPGRLTQALGLSGEHDGLPLDRPPFELYAAGDIEIAAAPESGSPRPQTSPGATPKQARRT